jgi:hypothetical protein
MLPLDDAPAFDVKPGKPMVIATSAIKANNTVRRSLVRATTESPRRVRAISLIYSPHYLLL